MILQDRCQIKQGDIYRKGEKGKGAFKKESKLMREIRSFLPENWETELLSEERARANRESEPTPKFKEARMNGD